MSAELKAENEIKVRHKIRREISEAIQHGTETLTIHVGSGSSKRVFVAHKDLLAKHSEFFRAAASKEWKEGQEGLVTLEEDKPEVFAVFYNFLYCGRMFIAKEGDRSKGDSSRFVVDREMDRSAECWILGQKLLSNSFKDATTDAIIAKIVGTEGSPVSYYKTLYPRSSSTSAIRKLIVDIAVWKWATGRMEKEPFREESSVFWFDVAVAFDKIKKTGRPARAPYLEENVCIYHEHGFAAPCYTTMFPY